MSDPPDQHWMKVMEVATYLKVSKMTVYRMIHSGVLPAKRLRPGGYRVLRDDLKDLLDGSTH